MKKLLLLAIAILGFTSCAKKVVELPNHNNTRQISPRIEPMYGVKPVPFREKSMVPRDTIKENKLQRIEKDESR